MGDTSGLSAAPSVDTLATTATTATLQSVEANEKPVKVETPKGFGVRHFQILLLFLGLAIAYGLRVNLSVGIVAMTDSSFEVHYEVRI